MAVANIVHAFFNFVKISLVLLYHIVSKYTEIISETKTFKIYEIKKKIIKIHNQGKRKLSSLVNDGLFLVIFRNCLLSPSIIFVV